MMPEKLIFCMFGSHINFNIFLRKILQKHPALAPKPRVGFEAEVMQKLQHPNIVTLGTFDGNKKIPTLVIYYHYH